MKKLTIIFLLLLLAGPAGAATYYKKANGTAANKAAATGNCLTCLSDPSVCMNQAVYDGETFSDGDIIISCYVSIGLPGKVWSETFINGSQTIVIPPAKYLTITSEYVTIGGEKLNIQ